MVEDKKLYTKIAIIVAIMTLVFGFLGAIIQQTFFAGSYAKSIENNTNGLNSFRTEFDEHRLYDDKMYLKKEVFDEFQKKRSEFNSRIENQLNRIEDKVDRIK